jgi:hypothetical protein
MAWDPDAFTQEDREHIHQLPGWLRRTQLVCQKLVRLYDALEADRDTWKKKAEKSHHDALKAALVWGEENAKLAGMIEQLVKAAQEHEAKAQEDIAALAAEPDDDEKEQMH